MVEFVWVVSLGLEKTKRKEKKEKKKKHKKKESMGNTQKGVEHHIK